MSKLLKTLEIAVYIIGAMLVLWLIASWINVIMNNWTSPELIGEWNLFKVLIRMEGIECP